MGWRELGPGGGGYEEASRTDTLSIGQIGVEFFQWPADFYYMICYEIVVVVKRLGL